MTEPKEALKPCPFCGGGNVGIFHHNAGGWGVSFHVECLADKCGNRTCHHETETEAITAWNTRADASENAELREKLAEREWQPIETAPKDGSPILGFRADLPKCQIGVIAWHEAKSEGGLDHWNGSNGYSVMLMHPSHWQPLPAPPATGGDNAEG